MCETVYQENMAMTALPPEGTEDNVPLDKILTIMIEHAQT